MTLTFNPETYGTLLARYRPKTIKTDAENEQAIAIAEQLSHLPNKTAEEAALLELLLALIEKYEDEHYPMGNSSPLSMLLHLLDARGFHWQVLIDVLGDRSVTEEIINGKREISPENARALGNFFHVEPDFFLPTR